MGPHEQECSCVCNGGSGIESDGRGREYGGVVVVTRGVAECRPLTIVWQLHYFFAKIDSDIFILFEVVMSKNGSGAPSHAWYTVSTLSRER